MKSKIIKLIGLIFISYSIYGVQMLTNNNLNQEQNSTNNPFSGSWSWEKNSDISSFNMILFVSGNKINGRHCIIAQKGKKIDCSDENEYSIEGTISNGIASINYKSSYSSTKGTAEIKVLPNGNLEWKIIGKASGQTFFPNEAILVKK